MVKAASLFYAFNKTRQNTSEHEVKRRGVYGADGDAHATTNNPSETDLPWWDGMNCIRMVNENANREITRTLRVNSHHFNRSHPSGGQFPFPGRVMCWARIAGCCLYVFSIYFMSWKRVGELRSPRLPHSVGERKLWMRDDLRLEFLEIYILGFLEMFHRGVWTINCLLFLIMY